MTRPWLASSFLALATLTNIDPVATARAQTFDVKQLEVTNGAIDYGPETMFARGAPRDRGSDVNRHANEQALFYGLRDWWKISGALKFERPEEDELRLAGAAVANIFVFRALDDKRSHDIGFGWFTEATGSLHHNTTNSILFGPILMLKADKLSFTGNPFLEKTFGRNHEHGIALNYAWQLKYDLQQGFGIGVEGFGVVDNLADPAPVSEQEHRIGPVLFTEIELSKDFKLAVDVGLLFGLTPATPDVALKVNFGVPLYKPPGNGK
jgi:hypothetical protein